MQLRLFRTDDADAVAALFRDTIGRVNSRDYTPEQIRAWAPDDVDVERWRQRLLSFHFTMIAELAGVIVGFGNIAESGHLDCFYVHADHQREGIGRAPLDVRWKPKARRRSVPRLFTGGEHHRQAVFQRHGFSTIEQQTVECRGVPLVNFRMEKILPLAV